MSKITESESNYNSLEKMNTLDILSNINKEDKIVAISVEKEILKIDLLVKAIVKKIENGGRLFYLGAGTSGRLGILDASECPPTFGVDHELVIGIIAGGDNAIRKAVEFAEDDITLGWKDLKSYNVSKNDFVIGIASSGTTPYVLGALKDCQNNNILTGCIVCNTKTPIAKYSNFPIEIIVGPEFVTGSTRMKSGTAQKLVLNMISTTVMIKLGRVKGNKMIDMQLSNNKLLDRGVNIIMQQKEVTYQRAKDLLIKFGSVRRVLENDYE